MPEHDISQDTKTPPACCTQHTMPPTPSTTTLLCLQTVLLRLEGNISHRRICVACLALKKGTSVLALGRCGGSILKCTCRHSRDDPIVAAGPAEAVAADAAAEHLSTVTSAARADATLSFAPASAEEHNAMLRAARLARAGVAAEHLTDSWWAVFPASLAQ